MDKKRILISNDDGINSPGLRQLAEAAVKVGEVWIVAPDTQRSAQSHSFTFNKTIEVQEVDYGLEGVKAFSCSGTPADCMRIGILKVMPEKPDFAFSGINDGPNISWDIQYSGTVGAAMEARFLGVHSIAFSQRVESRHEVTDRYLEELMLQCMEKPLDDLSIWNINFPACSLDEFRGVLWDVRVSTDHFYTDDYKETVVGGGLTKYDIVSGRKWEGTEGTDLRAVIDNYIAIGTVTNLK